MTGTQEQRIVATLTGVLVDSQNQIRKDISDLGNDVRADLADVRASLQRMGQRIGKLEESPAQRLDETDIANIQTGAKVLAAGKWAIGPKRLAFLLTIAGSGGGLVVVNRIREWFF